MSTELYSHHYGFHHLTKKRHTLRSDSCFVLRQSLYVAQTGLKPRDLPALVAQVLEL
jgi:hypothetical protein